MPSLERVNGPFKLPNTGYNKKYQQRRRIRPYHPRVVKKWSRWGETFLVSDRDLDITVNRICEGDAIMPHPIAVEKAPSARRTSRKAGLGKMTKEVGKQRLNEFLGKEVNSFPFGVCLMALGVFIMLSPFFFRSLPAEATFYVSMSLLMPGFCLLLDARNPEKKTVKTVDDFIALMLLVAMFIAALAFLSQCDGEGRSSNSWDSMDPHSKEVARECYEYQRAFDSLKEQGLL